MTDQPAAIDHMLDALSAALVAHPDLGAGAAEAISLLPDTGLAHWHARIGDSGRLARIPKQSQMQLGAAKNLAYQAASFQAGEPSGHTPRFFGSIEPGDGLPMGALIVEAIAGRVPRLPDELTAIAAALAALHRCPTTGPAEGLKRSANPLTAMLLEVRDQAEYVEAADLDEAAEAAINAELQAVFRAVERAGRAPRALISFDAHPGNFLIEESGRAVLVDLDKMRLSSPGFDLAHATLYTSTTWDVNVHMVLSAADTAGFYRAWIDAMGEDAAPHLPYLELTRRLMWLWSVTWCSKWRALSGHDAKTDVGDNAEDWSAAKSEVALVAHVAERVGHYLDPETIAKVRKSLALEL